MQFSKLSNQIKSSPVQSSLINLGKAFFVCQLTVAGMSRKRWWRSHPGHLSRLRPPKRFSREGGCRKAVPAFKTPWRNFCNPDSYRDRRKINLSRLRKLSRAGFSKLVNGDKFCVMIKLSR